MATTETADTVRYNLLHTRLGPLWAALSERGACALDAQLTERGFRETLRDAGLSPERSAAALAPLESEFEEYLTGRRRYFDTPPDLCAAGEFQRRVLLTLHETVYGEVLSYADLAHRAGYPRAARAVGNAVATNPLSILIPCHRVIRSDGTPGNYAVRSLSPEEGRRRKLHLLALEGVTLG